MLRQPPVGGGDDRGSSVPLPLTESVRRAARIWRELDREDWLEAFAAHPRIGERTSDPRAASEQSGVSSASLETLRQLSDLNGEYEAKFGRVYLVCATGKSADQMLELLRTRLKNDATAELGIAVEEQLAITKLRLEKLG